MQLLDRIRRAPPYRVCQTYLKIFPNEYAPGTKRYPGVQGNNTVGMPFCSTAPSLNRQADDLIWLIIVRFVPRRPKRTIINGHADKNSDYLHRHPRLCEIPFRLSIMRLERCEEPFVLAMAGQNERFFAIALRTATFLICGGAYPCEGFLAPARAASWYLLGNRAPCSWLRVRRGPGVLRARPPQRPGRRASCALP